jgi:NADH-quinone oxidoreductase subunit C
MPGTVDTLTAKFPGAFSLTAFKDNARVELPADQAAAVLFDLLTCLKGECGFDLLVDVAGVDYLNYPNATDRYAVVYALANTKTAQRLFVKAYTNDPDPELPSAVPLWKGADWMEREVYDMFGVVFTGHPDLRRILMPAEFTSFPLRKDYPLRGLGERHNFPTITRAES